MMRSSWRAAGLLATVLTVSCSGDLLESGTPDAPSDPALEAMAIRLTVDLEAGVVRPAASQPAGNPAGLHLAYAILGTNEAGVTATNLVRSAPINGKVTVTFDAAVTNRMTAASLVPSTFPGSTASPGLLLFPFRVTQVVGGSASQVLATTEWDGDGTPGSGAPRNFFNDFGCPAGSNDCFRWEQYPAPLGPGVTTTARKVGFTLPRQITSFTVLLVLAADIANDLPGVASLSVTPPSYTFANGFPASFTATAYDSRGNPLPWATITWVTADITAAPFQSGGSLVGTITGPGVIVHARKVGPTSFTASSGGVSVTVPLDIQVNTVALVQVYVTPDSVLDVGETVQATAVVKDHSGQVIPGIAPLWDTSDPSVALVTVSGQIIAMGPGTVTVTATAGTQTGSAPITVIVPPAPGEVDLAVGDPLRAIGGLMVSINGATGTTSAQVPLLLGGVPPGPGILHVLNPPAGCSDPAVPVQVISGVALSLGYVVLPCSTGLRISVSSTQLGSLSGILVTVRDGSDEAYYVTDANGEIPITTLAPLPVTIDSWGVPASCFIPQIVTATPLVGGTAQADVAADCPGTAIFTGSVTASNLTQIDGSPVPIPGLAVDIIRWNTFVSGSTGNDGSYVVSGAPIGTVFIQFGSSGQFCTSAGDTPTVPGPGNFPYSIQAWCRVATLDLTVTDLSAVPTLTAVDVRVTSRLSGATYGRSVQPGTAGNSLSILGDNSIFDADIINLPPQCKGSTVSGSASTSSVALTVQCK